MALAATSMTASATAAEPTDATIQTSQDTYQPGAFYVRMKSANAPKLKSGERKVSVNRLAPLASLRERYSVHETMQSMRVFDNAELARTFLVEFDDIEKTEELLAKLAAMPEVEMVERVPMYFITGGMSEIAAEEPVDEPAEDSDATVNDPFYGVKNGTNFSWHLDLLHAEDAWKMQHGDSNIVVAVVDNAVWGAHPDLQIPSTRQYNVRDGKAGNSAPPVSVSQSTQCSNTSSCEVYNWSHGTHCAGAIGAINNNGVGIASIGSGVSVMGVSCPSSLSGLAGSLAVQNGFAGITYAAEHGARVISTSWGGYNISNTERAIIQACIDKGIVMVSAAGNDRTNNPFYPANLPGVISIASVNSDKTVSSFSNYGPWVMLASPGGFVSTAGNEGNVCIFSTTYCQSQRYRLQGVSSTTGEYYDGMFGTSMATPVASGLCGLLLSADSSLTPYLLREILMASAQTIEGNTKPIQPGSGIIDASAALQLVKNRKPMPRNITATREENSRTVSLAWQAPEEGNVKNYRIYVNGTMREEVKGTSWSEDVSKTSNLYHYGVAAVFEDGSVLRRLRRRSICLDCLTMKIRTTRRRQLISTVIIRVIPVESLLSWPVSTADTDTILILLIHSLTSQAPSRLSRSCRVSLIIFPAASACQSLRMLFLSFRTSLLSRSWRMPSFITTWALTWVTTTRVRLSLPVMLSRNILTQSIRKSWKCLF